MDERVKIVREHWEELRLNACCRAIEDEAEGRVGLAFEPLPDRKLPDVEGEVWLEDATRAPLRLDFSYTGLNRILRRYEVPRIVADIRRRATDRRGRMNWRIVRENTRINEDDYGGHLTFDRIDEDTWITRQWRIRLPIFLDHSNWHANCRTPASPEIRFNVDALPLERTGLVRGVGRVLGDSTASECAEGGRDPSPGDGGRRIDEGDDGSTNLRSGDPWRTHPAVSWTPQHLGFAPGRNPP